MSIRGLDRPLGMGEILDRAVTVSVQRFPMLIALLAVLTVPLAILQSFSANPLSQYIALIQAAAKGSKTDTAAILNSIPKSGPFDYAIVLIALLVSALLVGVITLAVARALAGESLTIGGIYRSALRRLPSIVATGAIWFLILIAVSIVFSIVFGLVIFLVVRPSGVAVPAPGGIAAILLILVVALAISIPLGAIGYALAIVSFASAVLETRNPFIAIGRAFRRIFARREFLRSIVVSLALFAVTLATSLLGVVLGGILFALTKWFASYIVIAQLFSSIGLIFSTATATIYYLDVRLRREGADLMAMPTSVPSAPLA